MSRKLTKRYRCKRCGEITRTEFGLLRCNCMIYDGLIPLQWEDFYENPKDLIDRLQENIDQIQTLLASLKETLNHEN